MKRFKCLILLLMVLLACLSLSGCDDIDNIVSQISTEPEYKTVSVDGYNVSFSCLSDWEKVDKSNFDNRMTKEYERSYSYFNLFVYGAADISDGTTPRDVFDGQRDSMAQSREDFTEVFEGELKCDSGKQIYTGMYHGNKDSVEYAYYMACVEFDGRPDDFVWAVFTATPEDADENLDEWNEILRSFEYNTTDASELV